jgi:hypothetical protein
MVAYEKAKADRTTLEGEARTLEDEVTKIITKFNIDADEDEKFDATLTQTLFAKIWSGDSPDEIADANFAKARINAKSKIDDLDAKIIEITTQGETIRTTLNAARALIPAIKPLQVAASQVDADLENTTLKPQVSNSLKQKLAALTLVHWGDVNYKVIEGTVKDADDNDKKDAAALVVDLGGMMTVNTTTNVPALAADAGNGTSEKSDGTNNNDFVEKYAEKFIKGAGEDMNSLKTDNVPSVANLRTTIQEIRAGNYDKDKKDHTDIVLAIEVIRRTKYATGAFTSFADTWRTNVGTVQGITTSAGKQGV